MRRVKDFEVVTWLHTRNVSARHAVMFFLISRAGIFAASALSTSGGSSLFGCEGDGYQLRFGQLGNPSPQWGGEYRVQE